MMKFVAIALLATLAVAYGAEVATVKLVKTGDESKVGSVTFTKVGDVTTVRVVATGLAAGAEFGIHVHQYGDQRRASGTHGGSATSQGGHFDPKNTAQHAWPGELADDAHHAGDLGNWTATAGAIDQTKTFTHLALSGAESIIGKSVVVHAGADIGSAGDGAGSAGSRVADGVIGIANAADNVAKGTTVHSEFVAVLSGTANCADCKGFVWVTGTDNSTRIRARLSGYEGQLKLGFHIHAYGDMTNDDGTSAGGHYNPDGYLHGLPGADANRHAGDLGYLQTYEDAAGWMDITVNNIAAYTNLAGRSIVVHERQDKGREFCDHQAGDAGKRWFQGVLGHRNPGVAISSVSPATATINNAFVSLSCAAPDASTPPTGSSASLNASTTTPEGSSAASLNALSVASGLVALLALASF